jgi:hypothetical protein
MDSRAQLIVFEPFIEAGADAAAVTSAMAPLTADAVPSTGGGFLLKVGP